MSIWNARARSAGVWAATACALGSSNLSPISMVYGGFRWFAATTFDHGTP